MGLTKLDIVLILQLSEDHFLLVAKRSASDVGIDEVILPLSESRLVPQVFHQLLAAFVRW